MEFINFISELFLFASSPEVSKSENKSLLSRILFNISLIIGIIWIVIEIQTVHFLDNPYLFVGLALMTSVVISVLVIVGLFKLNLFNSITLKDFCLWLLVLTLNFTATISFLNRHTEFKIMNIKNKEVSKS